MFMLGESEAVGAPAVSCWRREKFAEILRRVSIVGINNITPLRFASSFISFRLNSARSAVVLKVTGRTSESFF